jgi:polysaccharide deacetylase family protein (PEP-CTERM system associated)
MTVDVEEHFQVSAFAGTVSRADWDTLPSRVERNTHRLLELLDETGVKATFFVLGWIAERKPRLVREIGERGHEIASHGQSHALVYDQDPEVFRAETVRAKRILEEAAGRAVRGYRAASFSITRRSLWALDVLAETGFVYDSSLYPVVHDVYGMPGAPRTLCRVRTARGNTLIEFPPSTLRAGRFVLPVAGGGYLRLFPLRLTLWAIRRLNHAERAPAVVYLHPWELDPEQPRIRASWKSRIRHYVGLTRTRAKLVQVLRTFPFAPMGEIVARSDDLAERRIA